MNVKSRKRNDGGIWAVGSRGVDLSWGISPVLYDGKTKEIQRCVMNGNPKFKKYIFIYNLYNI